MARLFAISWSYKVKYGLIKNYELIGYPVGFKRNPNLSKQSNNVKRFNANSEVNQSVPSTSGFVSASFTNEQMMKLLNIINEKPSPSAIMLGIKPSFYNNNVFFNLHFEKNFCAKAGSVMFDVTLGWIIDLGANQHMTDSTKDMFNVVDISSLMLTVGRPNGTLSKINAIGSLRLTSGIVLFEVLVVGEYNVTLLSVNKMINDSKFFVGFGGHKCYIQHLKLDFTCLMLIKVAKQIKEPFPLSDHKSLFVANLVHCDVWGPYKVALFIKPFALTLLSKMGLLRENIDTC
ncbi:hypothetical protein Tco_0708306 [Tanacetum coccineum]